MFYYHTVLVLFQDTQALYKSYDYFLGGSTYFLQLCVVYPINYRYTYNSHNSLWELLKHGPAVAELSVAIHHASVTKMYDFL